MKECDYRGYHIESRLIGKWFAQIFPPGSKKALKEVPVATRDEGYDHLLGLVHALIDRQLGRAESSNRLREIGND